MIITCPDCTTRYDVDDERFSPDGRSVRCSSCGESWFVPAPELLDVEPLEEKGKAKLSKKNRSSDREDDEREEVEQKPKSRSRLAVGIVDDDDDDMEMRAKPLRRNKKSYRDEPEFEDDDDDALFDTSNESEDRDSDYPYFEDRKRGKGDRKSAARSKAKRDDRYEETDDAYEASDRSLKSRSRKDWRDDADESGNGREGKNARPSNRHMDDDVDKDDEKARRPFFARRRRNIDEDDVEEDYKDRDQGRTGRRESLRFADDQDADDDRDHRSFNSRSRDFEDTEFDEDVRGYRRDRDDYDEDGYVVDADFEDVDDDDEMRPRGFGRRVREGRRRATALARMEDVRPLDPAALDDEFFAALRVTPRELEKAIRKARRRAESREKNRLTPFRVFGWTAWLAAVAGACYAIVIYRDDIVKMAPKAADAYAVIGIEANPYGLVIENVRHRLAMSTNGATIEITGNLRNDGEDGVVTPLLQAEALGSNGELLARWTFTASQLDVEEGGVVDFVTRAPAPEGVSEVALSFAPDKSVLDSIVTIGE